MQNTAQWGSKVFTTSPTKLVPFDNLSTTFALKQNANNDTSGTPSTNTTGRELQTLRFETFYARATGCDPRAELEEWYSLIGAVDTLYIGGKQFGPDRLQLQNVEVSDMRLAPNGLFLMARLAITLIEYQPQEAKISTKPQTAQQSAATAATADSLTLTKVAAMSAKATKQDKTAMKPSAIQNTKVNMLN